MQTVTIQTQKNRASHKLVTKFQFLETALKIDENTTYEEWSQGMNMLLKIKERLQFYVADAVAFGLKKFGKEQVREWFSGQTVFAFEATLQDAHIASHWNKRLNELDFDYYRVVNKWEQKGKLTKAESEWWLKRAITENLTPNDLNLSIAQGDIVRGNQRENESLPTIEAFIVLCERWKQRLDRVDPIENWDAERAKRCLQKLKPVGDIIKTLVSRASQ